MKNLDERDRHKCQTHGENKNMDKNLQENFSLE